MLKLIYRKRCTGRTAELIKRSSDTGYPIMACNKRRAEHIAEMAKEMNIEIPKPFSVPPPPIGNTYLRGKTILIDDIEDVFMALWGCEVDTIVAESEFHFTEFNNEQKENQKL